MSERLGASFSKLDEEPEVSEHLEEALQQHWSMLDGKLEIIQKEMSERLGASFSKLDEEPEVSGLVKDEQVAGILTRLEMLERNDLNAMIDASVDSALANSEVKKSEMMDVIFSINEMQVMQTEVDDSNKKEVSEIQYRLQEVEDSLKQVDADKLDALITRLAVVERSACLGALEAEALGEQPNKDIARLAARLDILESKDMTDARTGKEMQQEQTKRDSTPRIREAQELWDALDAKILSIREELSASLNASINKIEVITSNQEVQELQMESETLQRKII